MNNLPCNINSPKQLTDYNNLRCVANKTKDINSSITGNKVLLPRNNQQSKLYLLKNKFINAGFYKHIYDNQLCGKVYTKFIKYTRIHLGNLALYSQIKIIFFFEIIRFLKC